MINGIDILAKTEMMQTAGWINGMAFLFSSATLYFFGNMILEDKRSNDTASKVYCMLMFASLSLAMIFGLVLSNFILESTGRYEYKVTIDYNAKFKEVYENYDIIDVEGEIYTIQDKKK